MSPPFGLIEFEGLERFRSQAFGGVQRGGKGQGEELIKAKRSERELEGELMLERGIWTVRERKLNAEEVESAARACKMRERRGSSFKRITTSSYSFSCGIQEERDGQHIREEFSTAARLSPGCSPARLKPAFSPDGSRGSRY